MRFTPRHSAWEDERSVGVHPDLVFTGTPGDDHLGGTATTDSFDVSQGGDDRVAAKGGDDTVYFGAAFTGADRVDGGKGVDTVTLDGDYSAGIEVRANSFARVEQMVLEGGSYVVTGEIESGRGAGRLTVDAYSLSAEQSLRLDIDSSGDLDVLGGAGDDVLRASSQDGMVNLVGFGGKDTLIGGDGDVIMYGGIDADRIEMNAPGNVAQFNAFDSSAKTYDTIVNFEASGGKIWFLFDSNTTTPQLDHDFHLGKTVDRVGDILSKYDAQADETVVKVFTDHDKVADFVLHLTGDVHLTTADFIFG